MDKDNVESVLEAMGRNSPDYWNEDEYLIRDRVVRYVQANIDDFMDAYRDE